MLINELVGYKENPIYQKAISTFKSGPYDHIDTEFKREKKLSMFTDELKKHRFIHLGSGSFGAVFEKPGYPWLFKIFNTDPAYLFFLKWAIAHQDNPHVPKIKGKIIKINRDTYAVRLEKLRPCDMEDEILNELDNIIYRYLKYNKLSSDDKNWIESNCPKILEIIDAMRKSGYQLDLKSDNIMMRGDVPVVTDPIWFSKI